MGKWSDAVLSDAGGGDHAGGCGGSCLNWGFEWWKEEVEEGCGIHLDDRLSDLGNVGVELSEHSEAEGGGGCDVPGVDCWMGEGVAIRAAVLFFISRAVMAAALIVSRTSFFGRQWMGD